MLNLIYRIIAVFTVFIILFQLIRENETQNIINLAILSVPFILRALMIK